MHTEVRGRKEISRVYLLVFVWKVFMVLIILCVTFLFLHVFRCSYIIRLYGYIFSMLLQPASVQQIPIPIYAPLQGQHQAQLSLGAGPAVTQAQELFTSSLQPYR